jgi:hypothetical protein
MGDIAEKVAKYFRPRAVRIDSHLFTLTSKFSVAICIVGSLLCAATQFWGDPITCDFKSGIDAGLAKQHCWLHGSNWIPKEYQQDVDCFVSQKSVTSQADAPDTSYYQWVILFLLVEAAIFALPYRMWKVAEGGLMKGFDAAPVQSVLVLGDDDALKDHVRRFAKLFKSTMHRNNRYFASYVVCEALNVLCVVVGFYAADIFLNSKFRGYGFEVLSYYRKDPGLRTVNPFCEVFPTKVSCTIRTVGPAGGLQTDNGFCLLSQNVVNEKLFLVLFFWLVFLLSASAVFVLFRGVTLLVPRVREEMLVSKTRGVGMNRWVRLALADCYIGDWFVLLLIARNVNPYFFRELIVALGHDYDEKREGRNGVKRASAPQEEISLMKFEAVKDNE